MIWGLTRTETLGFLSEFFSSAVTGRRLTPVCKHLLTLGFSHTIPNVYTGKVSEGSLFHRWVSPGQELIHCKAKAGMPLLQLQSITALSIHQQGHAEPQQLQSGPICLS